MFSVAVPSPPVNIRVAPQSPESILVSWDPPLQPKGQILKYLLSYEDAHGSPKQIEVLDTRKLLTGKDWMKIKLDRARLEISLFFSISF